MRMLSFIAMLALSAAASARQEDGRIDPKTGRDMANYPPNRHFDHLHMKLEVDIPTMDKPELKGVETLTVTPIGRARDVLELDAGTRMKIDSITMNGADCKFTREQAWLSINLPRTLSLGEKADIVLRYSCDYPNADGTGLTWTAGREGATSPTDKAPQIHSQGQPDYNHTWFACQDFPNERVTTELLVTVEDGFIVGSNGHLVSNTFAGERDGKKYSTWHWLQDKPHCYYLVVMIVGKFSIVGLPIAERPKGDDGQPIECYLYAPIGNEKTAQRAYAKTPAMVAHFSKIFDEPYPWDKYAQGLVRNFRAGGMENTSLTTMQSSSARAGAGTQDDVISHELAHQWFGDLMTCKGWEHAWLNEGWASYAEALWAETEQGKSSRRSYQRLIAGFVSAQRGLNRTYAPLYAPLVSNRYGDAMEPFMKPNDIYSKGAVVLHMLRMRLGDEAFFRGVRNYIDHCKLTCVETEQFRYFLEEASGLSLDQFFSQWCYRPGLPRLSAELEWEPGEGDAGELFVSIDQTQRIDGANPAYSFTVPIQLKYGEKGNKMVTLDLSTKHSEAAFKLDSKPEDVVFDPQMTIAAPTSIKKPLAMWLRQINDESVFAQLQAIDHLKTFDDPAAAMALARVASDPDEMDLVRNAAAREVAGLYRRKLENILRLVPRPTETRRAILAQEVSR